MRIDSDIRLMGIPVIGYNRPQETCNFVHGCWLSTNCSLETLRRCCRYSCHLILFIKSSITIWSDANSIKCEDHLWFCFWQFLLVDLHHKCPRVPHCFPSRGDVWPFVSEQHTTKRWAGTSYSAGRISGARSDQVHFQLITRPLNQLVCMNLSVWTCMYELAHAILKAPCCHTSPSLSAYAAALPLLIAGWLQVQLASLKLCCKKQV